MALIDSATQTENTAKTEPHDPSNQSLIQNSIAPAWHHLSIDTKRTVLEQLKQEVAVHDQNVQLQALLSKQFPHLGEAITVTYSLHSPIDLQFRQQYFRSKGYGHSRQYYEIHLKGLKRPKMLQVICRSSEYIVDACNYKYSSQAFEERALVGVKYGDDKGTLTCDSFADDRYLRTILKHGSLRSIFEKLLADLEESYPQSTTGKQDANNDRSTRDAELLELLRVFIPETVLGTKWWGGGIVWWSLGDIILQEIKSSQPF